MTPEQLDALWQAGQEHEASGSPDAARKAYQQILDESPRQFMVHLRLSELEQRSNHYRAARQHALDAAGIIALAKRWEGMPFTTARLLQFDERPLVRDMILSADWNDVRVIRQSPVLSQHLWLCGDQDAALRLLDAAERRIQGSHRLAYSRAIALQHLGRIDAATKAFEDAIRLAPDFALAHWSLAYHAPSAVPGSRIERIRAAAGRVHEPVESAMLHYALYKELDESGKPEAAWDELSAGAALMRRTVGYDSRAFDTAVAALLDGQPLAPGRTSTAAGHVPVFVVGMPRTGTTLLSRILGAHPAVADAGELNSLEHAVAECIDEFVELPFTPEVLAKACDSDLSEVASAYMRRTKGYFADDATHAIDKNPMNLFATDLIVGALPQARVLCMVRDAMDTCHSNLTQLFQNGAFAYSYDQRQLAGRYAGFRKVVAAMEARYPENFLAVSYEALVRDPVAVGRQVMAFCGLDFDPIYADITLNTTPSATASTTQIRQPVHDRGIGSWRRHEAALQTMAGYLSEFGFDR